MKSKALALTTLFITIPCAGAQVGPILQAPHTECVLGPGEKATVQRYWPANAGTVVAAGDTRCSTDGIGRRSCSLSGWLYTPKSGNATNHPTLIFNHGSGDSPREACSMIQYFLARGFVVFTPFRRGTSSLSGNFTNTGETEGSYVSRHKQSWLASHSVVTVPDDVVLDFKVAYNADGVAEVKSAIAYAVTQPVVDFARMAIAGHSFGGMTTLFAASQLLTPPPQATVILSGSVLSWDAHLEQLLAPVAANHIGPILFTQTVNEGPFIDPTAPTLKQLQAAEGAGFGEVEAAIFSRVPGVAWGHDAHVKFMMDDSQVQRRAPVVTAFLARQGVK